MSVLGTVGGEPFTEDMAQALADGTESGFAQERLTETELPPGVGPGPGARIVRLPTALYEALGQMAAATEATTDDLAARAGENLLAANG